MSAFLRVLLVCLGLLLPLAEARAQTTSPFSVDTPGASAVAAPGPFQSLRHQVFAWQRDVNKALNDRLVAIKAGEDPGALWAGLVFAFLYGVLHALGPGHGKAVVVGYFLGRAARPLRGIAMAGWIAVSHVVGAVVIVGLAHLLLSRALASPTNEYFWLRMVSYGAILAIGLLMLREWWRGGHRHHGHQHHNGHDHACGHGQAREPGRPLEQRALALAAGFVPCSGAILILLFTLANGLILTGIALAGAIAFGMGLTLAGLGLGSILLRRRVVLHLPDGGGWARGMALLGPLFVILVGGTLLALGLAGGVAF